MGFDEELSRVINFGTTAKAAIPGVKVAAPSTCAWWFCECHLYSILGLRDSIFIIRLDQRSWLLG